MSEKKIMFFWPVRLPCRNPTIFLASSKRVVLTIGIRLHDQLIIVRKISMSRIEHY